MNVELTDVSNGFIWLKNVGHGTRSGFIRRSSRTPTCGASFQSGSIRRDQSGVSELPWLPHPDLERTPWDVSAVELDVNVVDAVLPGDEADHVLVWGTEQRDRLQARPRHGDPRHSRPTFLQLRDGTLLQSSRGAVDFGLHLALGSI